MVVSGKVRNRRSTKPFAELHLNVQPVHFILFCRRTLLFP